MTTEQEKEYWDIFYTLQKLCHLSEDDLNDKEVIKHIKLLTNVVYFYRHGGVEKVRGAVREKKLKKMGVAILKPKGNS